MEKTKSYATTAVGLVLTGIGIALSIRSNLGVSPLDVGITGVAHVMSWPFWLASWVLGTALIGIGLLLGHKPKLGALVSLLVVGPIVTIVTGQWTSETLTGLPAWVNQSLVFAGGFACLSLGITLVVSANNGEGPAECVMRGLIGKNLSLVKSRWIIDGTLVAGGWLLGGSVGIGTLIYVVGLGAAIRLLMSVVGKTAPEDVDQAEV